MFVLDADLSLSIHHLGLTLRVYESFVQVVFPVPLASNEFTTFFSISVSDTITLCLVSGKISLVLISIVYPSLQVEESSLL